MTLCNCLKGNGRRSPSLERSAPAQTHAGKNQGLAAGHPQRMRAHSIPNTRAGNPIGGLDLLFDSEPRASRLDMIANRQAAQAWIKAEQEKQQKEKAAHIEAVVASRDQADVDAVKKREISDNALLSGYRPQMEREYDRLVYEEGTPGTLEDIAQIAIRNVYAYTSGSVNADQEAYGGYSRR